ncbi:hypothetical protein QAD02_000102 [Eretmocerus hayati]|uniref:Uncharacterized protein n=1 Tax=Eretmocerus hayati TaxID=131215 RepID=A0ACC2NCL9_9HYME|nr:hypothetical protein QAD02_000102 [Eretmocerus hayati]
MAPTSPLIQAPVFAFPNVITFYLDDPSTHKRTMSVYNPYNFTIRFKVLCTAPSKYVVCDPEGTLRPNCYMDLSLRHIALTPKNCMVDKFRVLLYERSSMQLLGKKEIESVVVKGIPPPPPKDPESFEQLENTGTNPKSFTIVTPTKSSNRDTNYVALLAGLVCIGGLLLPNEGEQMYGIPSYLHISSHIKLVFSFVLGMVTIIVLRL